MSHGLIFRFFNFTVLYRFSGELLKVDVRGGAVEDFEFSA